MFVPCGYLEYAHGPAAETGYGPALRLFQITAKKNRVEIDLADEELREELRDVAEIYEDGRDQLFPRRHIGTARQILREIREFEKGSGKSAQARTSSAE